jgi:acyl carrier protein
VLRDALLADQSWPRFAEVMGPKIKGAANLDTLTRARALDFFVLFSSGSSLLGSPGQLNYSAANAWMDALAHRRRGDGLCATAINWGPWGEVGMAAGLDEATRRRQAARGLGVIPPPEGFLALDHLMARAATQAAVLPIDWPTVLGLLPEPPPFLTALAAETPPRPAATPSETDGVVARLQDAAPEERHAILEAYVRQQVVQVLALDPSHVPGRDEDFRQYGMDSLMAVDLRNRLQAGLGRAVPSTVALEHSTIGTLASFLVAADPVTGSAPSPGTLPLEPQLLGAVRARGAEAAVDDLSATEVDRLLQEMMRRRTE